MSRRQGRVPFESVFLKLTAARPSSSDNLQVLNDITFNRYIRTAGADAHATTRPAVPRVLLGQQLSEDRQYCGVAVQQLGLGTRAVDVRRRRPVVMVVVAALGAVLVLRVPAVGCDIRR